MDIVLSRVSGEFLPQVSPKVRIINLASNNILFCLPALVRYLRTEKPIALLSVMDKANIIALWARHLAGTQTRVILSVHVILSQRTIESNPFKSRLINCLVRQFYNQADAIVAVSKDVADDLCKVACIPRERISVIHNPLAISEISAKANERLYHAWFIQGSPPVILSVGRLRRMKDFPTLLAAFALVSKQRKAHLVILGEGEDRPRIEKLATNLGISEDISMPGFVENPYAYMSRASVFVLSSISESFGIVLTEAMSCGLPIVAADCPGGPRELLADGQYGKLVSVGDIQGFANAILETLSYPPNRSALKERAKLFCIERIARQYLDILMPETKSDM